LRGEPLSTAAPEIAGTDDSECPQIGHRFLTLVLAKADHKYGSFTEHTS